MTRPQKLRGGRRTRLTHIEIRRGSDLRIRLSIADDAFSEAGDELGALLRKISPGTETSTVAAPAPPAQGAIVVTSPEAPSDFVVSPEHDDADDAYHAGLRDRLSELFGSLCDTSLEDALEIARLERARRMDGGN